MEIEDSIKDIINDIRKVKRMKPDKEFIVREATENYGLAGDSVETALESLLKESKIYIKDGDSFFVTEDSRQQKDGKTGKKRKAPKTVETVDCECQTDPVDSCEDDRLKNNTGMAALNQQKLYEVLGQLSLGVTELNRILHEERTKSKTLLEENFKLKYELRAKEENTDTLSTSNKEIQDHKDTTESVIVQTEKDISNSDVISPKFVIDDEVVPMINEAKYLGIQIDKTLGWKEHINIIAAKISRGIGMLRYAKRYVPLSTVKTMYRSIVEPYLRYCCTVWGCCTEADLKRLQILQNRAARIVTNSAYDAHSLPLIKGLGWLTVKELIRFETATTVFKSVNQLCSDYMAQMFQRQREQAMRTLRNTETDLRLPLFRTNNGQKSFAYRGATVWNSLDHRIKLSPSLSNFKFKLKEGL